MRITSARKCQLYIPCPCQQLSFPIIFRERCGVARAAVFETKRAHDWMGRGKIIFTFFWMQAADIDEFYG